VTPLEIVKLKDENNHLKTQNNALRVANHKIQHRLTTLERSAALISDSPTEHIEEWAILREDVKRAAQDYHSDIGQLEAKNSLPSTKIQMLDNLFKEFSLSFAANSIDFKLKVCGSIPFMVENVIEQSKLETMIGDHLQNALIALNASDNAFRSVLAVIGLAGDCYEFSVYDSGVPFDVATLELLGTKPVTSYGNNGGNGIGFMTTFETMREVNASLIVSEKVPSGSDYTKSVTVRFDGERRYIIETYRTEDFLECGRYTICTSGGVNDIVKKPLEV